MLPTSSGQPQQQWKWEKCKTILLYRCSTLFGRILCCHCPTDGVKLDWCCKAIVALIFKIIPSSIEIIVTSISLEIPIQRLKNNKLDPCPVPFVKNDLILKTAVTWPDSSRFCTSKINSAYWFTQSSSKICYHTTGHNADITSPRVLLCWPVLVDVMIWVKRLFAVKYFGILLTNCLLSFFLSLCTPITCLITNNKTKNNRCRQTFAIILVIYPLSHYCGSPCWFHRAGKIQGYNNIANWSWESGIRGAQSKKIPSPSDILFYPVLTESTHPD